ncbi:MAG TPA: carboxyltransferase domain-containing protein, partial [Citricoccus sp.]
MSPTDHAAGPPTPVRRSLRPAGPRAVLVECASLQEVVGLHARLTTAPLPGQVEALAAAETVLVSFDDRATATAGAVALRTLTAAGPQETAPRTVEIDVVYDGEDLEAVGRLTGLGTDGVVRAHTRAEWTAAFGGFAPGFTYLVAADDPLQVPRRDSPRTAVPAGSVALAGHFSAVYPRTSPGGWQLIGHTDARMWDLDRPSPALVRPGDRVRYRAVRELVHLPGPVPEESRASHPGRDDEAEQGHEPDQRHDPDQVPGGGTRAALAVEATGLQCLVQDLGRPGLGDLGVPASGAADTASVRQANRLVGNAPGEAVLEILLGGLAVRARGTVVLALAGAETPARITA